MAHKSNEYFDIQLKYVADRNITWLNSEYSQKYSILDVITITERPIKLSKRQL